ncbi:MAG: hypothetical protein JRJ73_12210 [Deltaproteobacteria bacterium]|nr:hypothetical protein [Deltaproteobacteria bacterium]
MTDREKAAPRLMLRLTGTEPNMFTDIIRRQRFILILFLFYRRGLEGLSFPSIQFKGEAREPCEYRDGYG